MSLINAPQRNIVYGVIYVLLAVFLINGNIQTSVGATSVKSGKGSPPVFDETAERVHRVASGAKLLKLTCPVRASPDEELLIEWSKDDKEIRDDFESRYKITRGKLDLRIKNIKESDAGQYRCRVVNGFGHFDWLVSVVVYDPKYLKIDEFSKTERKRTPPRWINETEMYELTREPIRIANGAKLQLRCPAEGNPLPEIRWLKDGEYIFPIYNLDDRRGRSAEWSLRSVNSSSTGEYMCQISNQYGTINATFQVCIGDYRFAKTCKIDLPEIERPFYTVTQGRTAQLLCRFKRLVNDPLEPAIKWLKLVTDEAEIQKASDKKSYINYENSTFLILEQDATTVDRNGNEYINKLVIPNTKYENGGTYVCAVQSGSQIMQTRTDLRIVPDQGSSFSSLYFYLGIPVMILLLIFVACAVHFLHRNRQIEKPCESSRYMPDGIKPMTNGSKYLVPPAPLMPPPPTPVNPYMAQHTLSRTPPNHQYLTQDSLCGQSLQPKCYSAAVPSLNRSKRLPYQTCMNSVSQPYASESISNFCETSPTHFHSLQTVPVAPRADSSDFESDYPRGRRPCPTEVDDYSEQRTPFLTANAF